jgi:hypothetical protein
MGNCILLNFVTNVRIVTLIWTLRSEFWWSSGLLCVLWHTRRLWQYKYKLHSGWVWLVEWVWVLWQTWQSCNKQGVSMGDWNIWPCDQRKISYFSLNETMEASRRKADLFLKLWHVWLVTFDIYDQQKNLCDWWSILHRMNVTFTLTLWHHFEIFCIL